ncbi:MAG: hypothetical protein A2622_04385 [Bdellovibrionales bacterium RIFCSPHIGHO2_01_FULL_40_29]|nr:MAG: hypothetical protein A2622_04385 [Bdellovibrionales bacterium RIFCSPHIGHO2_01_FULL_40_29]OFZ34824.1 MAG: hypothetical protein A3D17_10990 [Bdellovibrionales bacterium RIFCSPHIGHO2_02_FULL_40_15]
MIISKDEIATFIPERKPRFVILGTMGSICARTINGIKPENAFFYHSNRNHFWKVLQLVCEPNKIPKTFSVDEKVAFLNKWRIAVANIVQEISIKENECNDPSDGILFKAHRGGLLKFKTVSSEFKSILKTAPIFFTCRRKKGIETLLVGYFGVNKLGTDLSTRVWYLPTPTRCNPQKRSSVWNSEIKDHIGYITNIK